MPEITTLSLRQWRQVDALCDQFEADWQQQHRPRIEEYLGRIEGPCQPALQTELVRIELEWRLRVGEQPSGDEYTTHYPALAGSLPDFLAGAQRAFAERTAAGTADLLETSVLPKGLEPAPTGTTLDFLPSAPEAVRRVGEYDLIEPIGTGGMGCVWKARHRRLRKLVALKLIRPGSRGSPTAVQRFLREMKAIGELDHPHVVEACDAGESDGTIYLAMKLIDGQDLARHLRQRGPLPIAEACALAGQVALGLQYLHERGLVHRDLKPGNLIRTPDGMVKVLDLGLARFQAEARSEAPNEGTQTGEGLGTPDYMAPEQISQAATVDIRADLYALGATLFHLLTGKAPFGHVRGNFEKMKAHESMPPADVRSLRPDVPGALAELVARLLAKRPAERPQTPREVADALAPFTRAAMVATATIGQGRAPRRRWRLALGVGTAALVIGALTLGPRWWSAPSGADPNDLPVPPRSENERKIDGAGALARPPVVLRFDVAHAERFKEGGVVKARERGLFGIGSFSANFGDRATVSVRLSRPAYGYLLAYAASGKEYLLDPPEKTALPAAGRKLLRYPSSGKNVEYVFDDGVGLHVFLAVLSDEPLPAYAEWQKKHGQAPWARSPARLGAVWRQVGGDLYAATADSPDVRGPGAEALGSAPVEKLAAWWRKQPGIVEVGLTGFAVTEAE